MKIRGRNNCWICEGFREIQFEFTPEEPIPDPGNHLVKIHLDFDGYKPFDMIYNGTKYQIIRMCPPGEVKYFFTFDTKPVTKESANGVNKFHEIKNKNDYIKYTFGDEYMEELNNIREKLLYEQESEEVSEEMNNTNNEEGDKEENYEVNNIGDVYIDDDNQMEEEMVEEYDNYTENEGENGGENGLEYLKDEVEEMLDENGEEYEDPNNENENLQN